MNESTGVKVEHGFADLVEDPLFVFFLQNSLSDQSKQIDVHVLEYQVNIDVIIGANDLLQLDNVRMFQFHEKHDLSVGSLSICRVIKGVKIFFKSFNFLVLVVDYFPYMTVGATADFFEDFELAEDVGLEVFSHIFIWECVILY